MGILKETLSEILGSCNSLATSAILSISLLGELVSTDEGMADGLPHFSPMRARPFAICGQKVAASSSNENSGSRSSKPKMTSVCRFPQKR